MKRIVSRLFRLRALRLLIWPLKTSVTSDHCCFVMLHSRPRGSEKAQGLPFISADVLKIGPDTNSITAEFVEELHFQVENLGKAADEISRGPFLVALVWIQSLSVKEPQPGDVTESQGKINAFTANLHPLMLFPAI